MNSTKVLGIFVPKLLRTVQANDGWNDGFGWVSLDTARRSGKPAMVIVHKPECPRCRKLKSQLAGHAGVRRLSAHFAMVHVRPEDLPSEDEGKEHDVFYPDGKYVPRILFFDANFNFLPQVRGSVASYQYFYMEPNNIEINMRRVLEMDGQSK